MKLLISIDFQNYSINYHHFKQASKKLTCNIVTLKKLDPSFCLSPLLHPPQSARKGWVHVCPGLSCLLQLRTLLPLCPFPRAVYLLGGRSFSIHPCWCKTSSSSPQERRSGSKNLQCQISTRRKV